MKFTYLLFFLPFLITCQSQGNTAGKENAVSKEFQDYSRSDTATFAGGCFWCIEASFEQIRGVEQAVSGYAGGDAKNADYQSVSSGKTKHTETVQVYYNPEVIDYPTLLDIFFTAHDPTQVNRQGPDVGPQYRTAVFYHNKTQKKQVEAKIAEIQRQFNNPIATELIKYDAFYKAEEYHQDYEEKHPFDRYIQNVSKPKIEKVKKRFSDKLKKGY